MEFDQAFSYDALNRLAGADVMVWTRPGDELGGGGSALASLRPAMLRPPTSTPAGLGGGTEMLGYYRAGHRVAKIMPSSTTVYVYDAFNQLAAEYSTTISSTQPCSTCYLSTDHLGSTRLVTDANANVVARHDYLPFGEELPGGYAGRNSQWAPGGDNVEQKFTGQIRDGETGLDFFNARYLAAPLGRFTSPDPGNAGANPLDPQTWNGYAYVNGNPLNSVDPSGMGNPCEYNTACLSGIAGCLNNVQLCQSTVFNSDPLQGVLGFDPFRLIESTGNIVDTSGVFRSGDTTQSFDFGPQWLTGSFQSAALFISSGSVSNNTHASPPKSGTFTRMPLPPNHLTCTSLGTSYEAPPNFSLKVIVKAGQASGRNLFALRRAVGQGGTFDFQRVTDSAGNVQFYGSFTPVSNFAVGAYEFGAGFTRGQGDFLSNLYARLFSSNAGDPKQELYRHLGYDAATKGDSQCH